MRTSMLVVAVLGDVCGSSPTPDGGDAIATFTQEVWTWDQAVDRCSYSNNGNAFWHWMVEGREPGVYAGSCSMA